MKYLSRFKSLLAALASAVVLAVSCGPIPAAAQPRPDVLIMETGVNAVTAGGNIPGWVSGDVASLAAAASVTVIFDLGPNWRQYTSVFAAVYPVGPSSGFSNVDASSSDTAAVTIARRLTLLGGPTGFATIFVSSLTTANGTVGVHTKPAGRFFVMRATNADGANALGATAKITLAAYP